MVACLRLFGGALRSVRALLVRCREGVGKGRGKGADGPQTTGEQHRAGGRPRRQTDKPRGSRKGERSGEGQHGERESDRDLLLLLIANRPGY